MNLEPSSGTRAEDPSSERWIQYYKDARARRHARPVQQRTRELIRRYYMRQTLGLFSGFIFVGVLLAIFYRVLQH